MERVPRCHSSMAYDHYMVFQALRLQKIVKFIHEFELLVMCGGYKLLVETPGGQSGV